MAGRILNVADLWTPTAKNEIIRASNAVNKGRFGGTGSSKSSDMVMEVVQNYMFRWPGLHALWLRRTWSEIEKTTIRHFKEFVPEELWEFNDTKKFFRLKQTKSVLQFGHLENGMKDIEQYLSEAYVVICVDECGTFPFEAYDWFSARNRLNPECKPDQNGQFPVPVRMCASNPVGPYWSKYKEYFVTKKPRIENARRDLNGRYWVTKNGKWGKGDCSLVYNPDDWAYVQSTILDNPHLMERDPDQYYKLQSIQDPALREKFLYGSLDAVSGQYFENFDPTTHVLDTDDPDAVIWQPWQPRWIGWDWGRAHWTAVYWFTIALVKSLGGEYKQKTVCYREYVDRGKSYESIVDIIHRLTMNGLPGKDDDCRKAVQISKIFLSHEKFNKRDDEPEAASNKITRLLTARGMPAATKFNAGPGSRIQKAQMLWNMLQEQQFMLTKNCTLIIEDIANLIRDPDNIEDVLKTEERSDDEYDGLTGGLYSFYSTPRQTPQEVQDAKRLESMPDEFTRRLEQYRISMEREKQKASAYDERPVWMTE